MNGKPLAKEKTTEDDPALAGERLNASLRRLAHMFDPYRDDPLMRDLCRLAIKCVQEGLTHG